MPHGGGFGDDEHGIARMGVGIALLAFAIQSALYTVNVYAFDRSIVLFDLEEGGLVTWASSSAAFAVGLIALLLSFIDEPQRLRGKAIAAAAAFISFDDAVLVHERAAFRIAEQLELSDTYVQLIWPTLYFPFLVAVAVLLFQLARNTRTAHRLIVAGLVALMAAIAMEVAGLALDRTDAGARGWARTLEITLEEGAELLGWILIATGAAVRLLMLQSRDQASPERTR